MPSIGRRNAAEIVSRGEMKTVIVVAALIIEQRKILVTQRKKDAPHGLLWEFPGGKMKEGEEPREALRRELREELAVEVEVGMIFDAVFYPYPTYPILLLVYHCRVEKGSPKLIGCHDLQWVNLRELKKLTMPPADDPIRKHLFSLEKELLLC
jgi:8-oxo-dGTP diphosphatase